MSANRILSFGVAAAVILLMSAAIANAHFPPVSYGYGKWAFSTASIASGLLVFSAATATENGFLQAAPWLLVGIIIPVALFVRYFTRGRLWMLVVASAVWIGEGYMATIGAWF